VEGYKQFKWGMSLNETKKIVVSKSFCNLKDSGKDSEGIHTLYCDNFPFGEHPRLGFFLFIDDRLFRVGIAVRAEEIEPLIEVLNKQFGRASSGDIPRKGQLEVGTIGWDNDTVILKISNVLKVQRQAKQTKRHSNSDMQAVLIYSSSEFEKILRDRRKSVLEKSVK